jgi:hypothetical protein
LEKTISTPLEHIGGLLDLKRGWVIHHHPTVEKQSSVFVTKFMTQTGKGVFYLAVLKQENL